MTDKPYKQEHEAIMFVTIVHMPFHDMALMLLAPAKELADGSLIINHDQATVLGGCNMN